MQNKKLSLVIATTPYGGNGQASSEHPDVRNWLIKTIRKIESDSSRISSYDLVTYNDTPCHMVRNRAVMDAREAGADLLMFVDSDQSPDDQIGIDANAVPFWDTAFNFIYRKWDKGPHVVGAPYMGGGEGYERVFVSKWRNRVGYENDIDFHLDSYTREEATTMAGIQECATLPTGLILYAMPTFDLIEPNPDNIAETIARPLVKRIEAGNNTFTPAQMRELVEHVVHQTRKAEKPFFYYEYTDQYEQHKASTEDMTNTRDISLAGLIQLGYNPIHCAWSSWAGHWKPRNVSKPRVISASEISQRFTNAVLRKVDANQKHVTIDVEDGVGV